MTGISARYVPHVAIVTMLIAIPSLLHSRGALYRDDCEHAQLLRPLAWEAYTDDVIPEDRRHRGLERAAGEHGQWSEGSWVADNGIRVHWSVVRSFDPKSVYHRPQRQLQEGGSLKDVHVGELDIGDRTIPMLWNEYEAGLGRGTTEVFAGYLLVYGHRAIARPILLQLATAPLQFVQGRWPMTRYFAFARETPNREEEAREAVQQWLRSQWDNYQMACRPGRT